MLNISYNLSPYLLSELKNAEILRREVLLFTMPPKVEMDLQFEALIQRIKSGLLLSDLEVTDNEIRKTLRNQMYLSIENPQKRGRNTSSQEQVLKYKRALDYLKQNWLVTPAQVDTKDIINIKNISTSGTLKIAEKDIKEVLDYLTSGSDSPIIQAAIAKVALVQLAPFSQGNEIVSTLSCYPFLYKAGLDFRGLLVIERAFNENRKEYIERQTEALKSSNATNWLEYFVRSLNKQLTNSYTRMQEAANEYAKKEKSASGIGDLSQRQITILGLLDDPNAMITNRVVQKHFRISQITASRDLAKLSGLGLLFVHGKGRSVRYTKA